MPLTQRRIFHGSDKLTEFMLNHLVTGDVRIDSLGQFAAHMKITMAEYDNIRHDFHGNIKEVRWRVSDWRKKIRS